MWSGHEPFRATPEISPATTIFPSGATTTAFATAALAAKPVTTRPAWPKDGSTFPARTRASAKRAAICLQRPGRHDGRAVRLQRETNSPDSAAPFAGEAGGEAIQDNEAVLAKAWIERVRVRLRTGECRASAAVVEHGSSESGHCREDRGAHEQSPPACAPACLFDQRLELPDAAFDLILVDFRLARRCDRQALPLIG